MCGAKFINKGSKTSRDAFNQMGARAKAEGKKLMIFPEGKWERSDYVALQEGSIVVAEYDFLDVKKWIFNPGKITIKVLQSTAEYTKENIDDLVAQTRNMMLEELQNISKQKSE